MKDPRAALILKGTVQRLKDIRLQKKISHESLAAAAGVSRPAVSHIESGKRNPTLLMALKLSNGLGVELSSILQEVETAIAGAKSGRR